MARAARTTACRRQRLPHRRPPASTFTPHTWTICHGRRVRVLFMFHSRGRVRLPPSQRTRSPARDCRATHAMVCAAILRSLLCTTLAHRALRCAAAAHRVLLRSALAARQQRGIWHSALNNFLLWQIALVRHLWAPRHRTPAADHRHHIRRRRAHSHRRFMRLRYGRYTGEPTERFGQRRAGEHRAR